jgi:hypothetical protein
MSYLIQNRLAGSLVIEDISITLNAGESKLISDQVYNSSKKIKIYEQKKWVTSQPRSSTAHFTPYQITASPVTAPPPPPSVVVPPPPPPPPPVAPQPPVIQSPSPTTPHSEIALQGLVSRLETLVNTLQTPRYHSPSPIQPISNDPLFIPSKIVPESADVHINVSSAESDGQNFDSGLQALKKTRKKNE